jgi:hypothetical protein
MEWLDLDRLHSEHCGQGSGRTTRMLVEALAEVDFGAERVIVFGAHPEHLDRLAAQVYGLAREMGFEDVRYSWHCGIRVNNCSFEFWTINSDRAFLLFGNTAPVFRDHYAIEHRYRTARIIRDATRKVRYRPDWAGW